MPIICAPVEKKALEESRRATTQYATAQSTIALYGWLHQDIRCTKAEPAEQMLTERILRFHQISNTNQRAQVADATRVICLVQQSVFHQLQPTSRYSIIPTLHLSILTHSTPAVADGILSRIGLTDRFVRIHFMLLSELILRNIQTAEATQVLLQRSRSEAEMT